MCRSDCKCDSRGKKAAYRWNKKEKTGLNSFSSYEFNGFYTNFYDCYLNLVKAETIKPENRVSTKTLQFIQDFEQKLNCAGFCQTPDFWFYLDFFNGPPQQNCLTAMKNEFDKVDGALGYSFLGMGLFLFL